MSPDGKVESARYTLVIPEKVYANVKKAAIDDKKNTSEFIRDSLLLALMFQSWKRKEGSYVVLRTPIPADEGGDSTTFKEELLIPDGTAESEGSTRYTLTMPEEVYANVKRAAIDDKKNISEFVRDSLLLALMFRDWERREDSYVILRTPIPADEGEDSTTFKEERLRIIRKT